MSVKIGNMTPLIRYSAIISKIRDTTKFVYQGANNYQIQHVELTATYATKLASKFSMLNSVHVQKLRYSAIAHDITKGKHLDHSKPIEYDGHIIPSDLNRYVRMNLDILQKYGLDDYFNTDIQLHALSSGIFLIKEFNESDPQVLYPVFFHSCPILSVYSELDKTTRLLVDIIVLADKLSSNHIKRSIPNSLVRLDMDSVVFGNDGNEFNFTQGLFIARLLAQGSSKEKCSLEMTDHYYKRLISINPIIGQFKKCPSL